MQIKVDLIKTFFMTATASPKVNDQELMSLGLVESLSVNSFVDFTSSRFNKTAAINEKKNNDFINIFICHLIFYAFFCISLVLHIVFDLGLGSFVNNKFIQLLEMGKNTFVEINPSFA